MRRLIFLLVMLGLVFLALLQGCSFSDDKSSFSVAVIPQEIKGHAVPGQQVVYLVSIEDDQGVEPIHLSAVASNCSIRISPEIITGEIAEVYITPDLSSVGSMITVVITAAREGYEDTKEVTFEVVPGEDDRGPMATNLRDKFIPWLVANMPELGITSDTAWQGTTVSPQWLVVSHYLFFSEEWEMHIQWHNMIPPYDWVRIDLRKRFTENTPSYAFEIPSVSAEDEPVEIEVPEEIWR